MNKKRLLLIILGLVLILAVSGLMGCNKNTTTPTRLPGYQPLDEYMSTVSLINNDSVSVEIVEYTTGKEVSLTRGNPSYDEILRLLSASTTEKTTLKTGTTIESGKTVTVQRTIPYTMGYILTFDLKSGRKVKFDVTSDSIWFETDEAIYQASVSPDLCSLAKSAIEVANSSSITPSPIPATSMEPPFRIDVSTAPAHLPGELIMFGIGITNLSSGTITIDPFSPAMWIKSVDRNEIVYSSSGGQSTYDLQSGIPFLPTKDTWGQKDNNGQQVAPGSYEIGYEYVIIDQSTGKKYTATPTVRFQIVDPVSAMNKNLDLNQSVTAEGLTVTLKRIEMNAVETKVYTFTTPPEYSLSTDHPPYQMESLMTNSTAEYSINGGVLKQVKSSGGKADAEGVTLTWDNLEPMPLDAKELTFVITQLGDLKGRWEFKIKLN